MNCRKLKSNCENLAANGEFPRLSSEAERHLVMPDDAITLKQQIIETGARLVVIDPLAAALAGGIDFYKDTDVRRALAPLARYCTMTVAPARANKRQQAAPIPG